MKINVIHTMDFEGDVKTQADVDEVYESFRATIRDTDKGHDLADFLFVNADTNVEIEDEVE